MKFQSACRSFQLAALDSSMSHCLAFHSTLPFSIPSPLPPPSEHALEYGLKGRESWSGTGVIGEKDTQMETEIDREE